MNITLSYNNETIIQNWKKFYYEYESYEYEYLEDKEHISGEIDEISDYFTLPILSLNENNETLFNSIKMINSIYFDKNKDFRKITRTDSEAVISNLEQINEYFSSLPEIDFFLKIYQENEKTLRVLERNFSKKVADLEEKATSKINETIRGFTVSDIGYEFHKKYQEIKTTLWIKQAIFYLLGVFIPFMILDIIDKLDDNGWVFLITRMVVLAPLALVFTLLLTQIKEDRKTAQSYLHKGLVAKSYINYARTLEESIFSNDPKIKQELISKLLNISIETLKEDPANLWDKKSTANNLNIQGIVEKLIDKIPTK